MRDSLSDLDIKDFLEELKLYENPATEKQKRILQAAEKVFGQRGYEGAPTAEIAREAGVTERTLFKHFKTKASLLKRVVFALALKTILPLQIKRVNEMALAEHETFADLVKTLATDRLATIRKLGSAPKIVLGEILQNESFRGQIKQIWCQHVWVNLVAAIRRFQEQGKVRKDVSAETVARLSVTAVAGYVVSRALLTPEEDWDDEKEIADLAKLLTEGVGTRG